MPNDADVLRWRTEMEAQLDALDAIEEEKKTAMATFRKRKQDAAGRVKKLRRYIRGQEHEPQPELPGVAPGEWFCERDGHVFADGACAKCGLVVGSDPAAPKPVRCVAGGATHLFANGACVWCQKPEPVKPAAAEAPAADPNAPPRGVRGLLPPHEPGPESSGAV